ncbi:MAG: class I SAM-dependent methyltransferase [Flavobacteriales bacterium]|nr:class I SAM-dependent methyltransferase [Flavobacteriales bacterium]
MKLFKKNTTPLSKTDEQKEDKKEYWSNDGYGKSHAFTNFIERPTSFYATIFNEILSKLDKNAKIMEIGCSVGGNLNYMYEMGFTNVEGVDINKSAIDFGSNHFPSLSGKLFCGDAIKFVENLPTNEYDLIFTVGCLQNIPYRDKQIFSEIVRVSKKYILAKEPVSLSGDGSGIHSNWDYLEAFASCGTSRIIEKVIPNNLWGEKPEGEKVPVLMVFVK